MINNKEKKMIQRLCIAGLATDGITIVDDIVYIQRLQWLHSSFHLYNVH